MRKWLKQKVFDNMILQGNPITARQNEKSAVSNRFRCSKSVPEMGRFLS